MFLFAALICMKFPSTLVRRWRILYLLHFNSSKPPSRSIFLPKVVEQGAKDGRPGPGQNKGVINGTRLEELRLWTVRPFVVRCLGINYWSRLDYRLAVFFQPTKRRVLSRSSLRSSDVCCYQPTSQTNVVWTHSIEFRSRKNSFCVRLKERGGTRPS